MKKKKVITCESLPLIVEPVWQISAVWSPPRAALSIAQPYVKELISPSAAVTAPTLQETHTPAVWEH